MKILKWDFKRQLHPKPLPSNNIQEILVIMTGLKSKTYLIKQSPLDMAKQPQQ